LKNKSIPFIQNENIITKIENREIEMNKRPSFWDEKEKQEEIKKQE
jgi:hypothetical protein